MPLDDLSSYFKHAIKLVIFRYDWVSLILCGCWFYYAIRRSVDTEKNPNGSTFQRLYEDSKVSILRSFSLPMIWKRCPHCTMGTFLILFLYRHYFNVFVFGPGPRPEAEVSTRGSGRREDEGMYFLAPDQEEDFYASQREVFGRFSWMSFHFVEFNDD